MAFPDFSTRSSATGAETQGKVAVNTSDTPSSTGRSEMFSSWLNLPLVFNGDDGDGGAGAVAKAGVAKEISGGSKVSQPLSVLGESPRILSDPFDERLV